MFFKLHSLPDFLIMLFWNLLVIAVFHSALLLLCVRLSPKTLDPSRRRFAIRPRERNGRLYRDTLKIHLWKDHVPQYVTKHGFSKEALRTDMTPGYLEEFLRETCRGEWYHLSNLMLIPFFFLADPPLYASCFAFVLFVIHGACAVIQRYNRARLLILRRKLLRETQKAAGQKDAAEQLPLSETYKTTER